MHLAHSWRCNHKLSIVEVLKLPSPGKFTSWGVQKMYVAQVGSLKITVQNTTKEHTIPQQPIAYLHPPKKMNNKKYQQAFQREVHSHHSECARMDRESLYTALEPSRVTVSMTVNLIETCRCSWETLLLPSESQFCWLTKRLHPRKLTWNPKWWFGKGDSFWIWPFLIFLFDVRGVPNNSPMPIIQQSSHWDPGGGEKKTKHHGLCLAFVGTNASPRLPGSLLIVRLQS